MTTGRFFRRALRALSLGLCVLLATICTLGAAAGLYLSTSRGKDRLLRALVAELNQVLPGSITVRRIQQLGLGSVVLEGVVLTAPAGNEVLAAEHARAEIALRPLLDGRVVLPLVVLENGEGDLRQLTHPRAGLVSAVSVPGEPGASAPPAPPGAEPGFEIGALSLRDWRVRLPQAGSWTPSDVWLYSLQARISVGRAVQVELEHVDAALGRNGAPLGGVALQGHWSSQAGSQIELAANLLETDLALELKVGRWPAGDGDWRDVPVELRLQQRGLSAARLGQLALMPQIAPSFLGTLDATLHLQGTARQLRARGELAFEAGRLAFAAEARALSELDVTLDTEQLELRRLLSGAPDWRLGTRTRASLQLRPGRSAIGLKLRSQIILNQIALPALQLEAELAPDALRRLELQLDDRWLALAVQGDLGFDGAAQLRGRGRVDLDGARRWLRAFALGRALEAPLGAASGSVGLELAVRRQPSGALAVQAELGSPVLEVDGTRLTQLRAALSFAGALPRPTSSLAVSWRAASRGAFALAPGELRIGGGPQRYTFQLKTGSDSFGSVAASGWLEPHAGESRFLIAGSGEFGGARWQLSMLPARSDGAHELTLPELRLVFAGQEARLHGSYTRRACDLTLEFAGVKLERVLRPLAPELARPGLLSGKLLARGSPERPELELELRGDALELVPGAQLDASLSARLDPAQDALEVRARLRDAASASAPRLDLVWRVRDDHAGALETELALDDAAGPWLHAQGELGLPHARARPSFAQLLAALPVGLPRALERESWQVELSAARRPLAQLPLPKGWAGLSGLELGARLAARHVPGAEPQGRLEFQLAEGARRARSTHCAAGSFSTTGSLELSAGRFEAALSAESNQTRLLSVTSSGALDAFALLRGGARRPPEVTLELDARELPLERLPFLCERVRGRLTASGRIRDPFGQGRAELQIALRDFSLGSDQTLDAAAELRASPSQIEWNGTLDAGERRSRFTGQLRRTNGASSGAAPVSVELALDRLPLAPFFPRQGPISHISGSLSGELRARGAGSSPELSGSLQLHDVAFTVTELAQPLSDINGELSLEQNELVLHQLTARDSNGALTLDGRLTLRGPRELEAGLNLKARKFPLRQSGQFLATTSANARIDLAWKPEQQDLRIRLLDMDIWLESNRAPEGLSLEPHPDVVVHPARGTGASLAALAEEESARARRETPNRMSIQIESQEGFWVRRADFDLKLATDLKLIIERPAPTPNSSGVSVAGEIRFERGYLELLGKMFEVRPGGTLRFPGSTAAVLDLVASYQDRRSERTVKVHLRGTASAPKLDFSLDDNPITAGEAFQAIYGSTDNSSDRAEDTEAEASQILSALTAGVITTSIRRRLGAMAPIVAVDPGGSQGVSQVRAGFELDTLIPDFLRDVVTGVYVEGILSSEKLDEQGTQRDVQPGVLIELHFPYNLVTSGRYGPDTTWTFDIGWQP